MSDLYGHLLEEFFGLYLVVAVYVLSTLGITVWTAIHWTPLWTGPLVLVVVGTVLFFPFWALVRTVAREPVDDEP